MLSRAVVTRWVIALFALGAGLAAGFQLRDPIAGTWALWRGLGPDGWDTWQRVVVQISPALVLPAAAVTVAVIRGARSGWAVGALAAIGLAAVSPWQPVDPGLLVVQRLLLAVVAGVLIGAAIAVTWRRRWGAAALITGVVAAVVIGPDLAAYRQVEQFTTEAQRESLWWWLPAALVLLAVIAGYLRAGTGPAEASAEPEAAASTRPLVTIVAALGVAVTGAALFVLVGADPGRSPAIIGGIALTLVVVALAGAAIGGQGLTGLAAALAVTVAAVAATVGADAVTVLDPVVLALGGLLALAGAYAGRRWPAAGTGFVVLMIVAGLAGLDPDDGGTLAVFRMLVTAGAATYLLCSLRPSAPQAGVFLVAPLLTVSAPAAWAAFLTTAPWTPGEIEPDAPSAPLTVGLTAVVVIAVAGVLAAIGAARAAAESGAVSSATEEDPR